MSMPGYINAAMEGFKHLKETNPKIKTIDDVLNDKEKLKVTIEDLSEAAARKIAKMNAAQAEQPINNVLPTLPSSADQNATVQ